MTGRHLVGVRWSVGSLHLRLLPVGSEDLIARGRGAGICCCQAFSSPPAEQVRGELGGWALRVEAIYKWEPSASHKEADWSMGVTLTPDMSGLIHSRAISALESFVCFRLLGEVRGTGPAREGGQSFWLGEGSGLSPRALWHEGAIKGQP